RGRESVSTGLRPPRGAWYTAGRPDPTAVESEGQAVLGCAAGPMRILITDHNFGDDAQVERALAETAGADVVVATCRTEEDVAEALEAYRPDAVLVQFAPVGERALASANGVAAIVRYGVGLDNVDTRAAERAGIAVAAIPDYCVDEVA